VDRVFLDANVLFSASYREGNDLLGLWKLADTELIASAFAMSEAWRNLATAEQRERLHILLTNVGMVPEPLPGSELPSDAALPPKDAPILLAAVQAHATHLLTGDKQHFGPFYERRIAGVLIQSPSTFLARRGL
jgi:uncharacterized protein